MLEWRFTCGVGSKSLRFASSYMVFELRWVLHSYTIIILWLRRSTRKPKGVFALLLTAWPNRLVLQYFAAKNIPSTSRSQATQKSFVKCLKSRK